MIAATTDRYISAYERLTGEPFEPGSYPVGERIAAGLDRILGTAGGAS